MRKSILSALILISGYTHAQKLLQPIEFSVAATTNEITFPDGSRRDEYSSTCIDSHPGSAFSLSSAKIRIAEVANHSEARCTFSAENYKELVPNFQEPTRLCANAFVVSFGGTVRAGKRGHLKCIATVSEYDSDSKFKPPSQRFGDISINNPTIPLGLIFDREFLPFFEAAIPTRAINAKIDAEIIKSLNNISSDLSIKVPNQGFLANPYDSRELTYFVDIDANAKVAGADIGVRCDAIVRLLIPISKLKSIKLHDAGTSVNCRAGSYFAKMFDYELRIKKVLGDQVNALAKQTFDLTKNGIDITAGEDPELAQFTADSWLYGRHCRWPDEPAICFGLTWTNQSAFRERIERLSALPVSSGAIDKTSAKASLASFEDWTKLEGYWPNAAAADKFPSGFHGYGAQQQLVDDNDMVLFSGIMCRFGIMDGCDLVRNSIDSTGRPWRSPRRIGEAWTPQSATFSGDHLKGLLLYWVKTGDKKSFERFLDYIKTQKTASPSSAVPVQIGYSTCPQREPNFTCMIGSDWLHIQALAKRFGLQDKLPDEIFELVRRNQVQGYARKFEAVFSLVGYRMHLVAADSLIDLDINGKTPLTSSIFNILANRQPMNPFMALLNEGSTARVQGLIDAQCPIEKSRLERWDWSWQRGDHRQAWKEGMIWDCYLAYYALLK